MSEIKMTMNVLLSLIIQSKKTGSGKLGNGRLLVKLLQIIADNKGEERTHERNILACFNDDVNKSESYHKIDKLIGRFLTQGRFYPYERLSFTEFEKCIGNTEKIAVYLRKMESACNEIIDCTNLDSLVYTLLVILRQDISIKEILYGSEYISKDKLFGSYAHQKMICIEALMLGLLYHVHKNPAEAEIIKLLNLPDRLKFHTVRFSGEKSLDLENSLTLIENIYENAKHQKPMEMKYSLELLNEEKILTEIPDSENVFLYGVGGVGKSTLLLNQIHNENTVNFYFPLYQYRREIHENVQSESCWILLNILLKYHYQYEYSTYETCSACEGTDIVLQQLSKLDKQLKNNPDSWQPGYVLLLDGLNEMSTELQEYFAVELSHIVNEWKNIRIIVTGRTAPKYDVFRNFHKIEVRGITDSERDAVLSDFSDISINNNLMNILKTPMFLNMYLENQETDKTLNTRGEILDSYIMNWKLKSSEMFAAGFENSLIRFIVQYILPCAAKIMFDKYNDVEFVLTGRTCYEISRGDLFKAIDKAFKIYISDEYVYQSYIAPKGFRKKYLLEIREKVDFIELILENIGLMKISENDFHKLHFTHQYFRDYFVTKHILNLLDIIDVSYGNSSVDEQKEVFQRFELNDSWFIYNEFEIYRLLGEICGDYKNIPDASDSMFWYNRTILDKLLDMYRLFGEKEDSFHITENVINVMSAARNGVICNVDFRRLPLPYIVPSNIKFSYNGEDPSFFQNCIVDYLNICIDEQLNVLRGGPKFSLIWYEYAVSSPDKKQILIIFRDNYVLLWDNKSNKILWDLDLSEYAEHTKIFNYANFSPDGNKIDLHSGCGIDMYKITIDSYSGQVIGGEHEKFYECNFSNDKKLSKRLKMKIFQQLPHFKNCDFSGAKFIYEDYRELLRTMGAVII